MARAIEGFRRIVIWDPMSAYAVDVGPRDARSASYGTSQENYVPTRRGSRAQGRSRPFSMPLIEAEMLDHVRLMRDEGCPVKMVALGLYHLMWQEPTYMNLVPERRARGNFASAGLNLEHTVFHAAIWDSKNLIEGVPWINTEPIDNGDGTWSLQSKRRLGYGGPFWTAPSDQVEIDDCEGLVTGSLTLEMELPIGGATVQYRGGGLSGTIEALGYPPWNEGTQEFDDPPVLATGSVGSPFYLPNATWSLRMTADSASAQPELRLIDPGQPLPLRVGEFRDCNPAQDLCWELPAEIVVCCPSDGFLISLVNTAPYLVVPDDVYLDQLADFPDGVKRFSKQIRDDQGDDITIGEVDFTPSGITSAGTYQVEAIGAQYVDAEGRTNRIIDFGVYEPTAAASCDVTIPVSDSAGQSAERTFTIFLATP